VGKAILWRMIMRITVFVLAPVTLNLDGGWDAFLTEGALVPSVTVSEDTGLQVNLIGINNLDNHLREGQGRRMITRPKLD
jgi:hypothetical protein